MSGLDAIDRIELAAVVRSSPYPGARPFARADEAFFFGRDREALQLANMVATGNLTVLYGDSGVGKSSLVNTRLREALEEVEPDWLIISFRDWPAGCYGKLRAKAAEETNAEINDFASDLFRFARDNTRPVLIALDQFEEYFLYHPESVGASDKVIAQAPEAFDKAVAIAREDATLEAELAKLANSRRSLVRVLLSLRSDGLFLLDRLRLRIPAIFAHMMLLEPLDVRGAQDAVCGPINAYNEKTGKCIKVPPRDSDLVQALVDGAKEAEIRRRLPNRGRGVVADATAIGRDRVVAPFLQLALQTLWHEEIVQHGETQLRLSTLRGLAEIDEAENARVAVGLLAQRQVDKTLNCYKGDERTACADVLERMVLPSGRKVAVRADDFQNILNEVHQPYVERLLSVLSAEGEGRLLREFADADNQGKPHFEILHDALATPILNWISRVREEKRSEQERSRVLTAERAEAEKRLAVERAEAEKRLAAERAEAEKREELALERAAAERRLAVERAENQLAVELAGEQVRQRARKVLAAVVAAFLSVIAVAASHIALQSGIDRLTQFAKVDSQPEFRLRILASLAALDEARRFWPLTGDSRVLDVLQEKLTSSPRDGGTYSAFGVSADGTHIAWVDEQQRHIAVCPLIETETCSFSSTASVSKPYWIPMRATPSLISGSVKLRSGFGRLAVGFFGEDHKPAYYKEGILYYGYREGEDWKFVDVNTLVRGLNNRGIDALNGIASVDFIDGVMRVFVGDWPANVMYVTIVKSQADAEHPFSSSETKKVEWPVSRGPVDNAPPIFSSRANYAYLERKTLEPSSERTESTESVNLESKLVLVLGTPEGKVSVSLDDPHQQGSPVPPAAPARAVIGFSEDGRYVAARHRGFVRVFDVTNPGQDPEGPTFIQERYNGPARDGRGTSWFSPPLGILAGNGEGNWFFAWASEPGLEVLSGRPGEILSRSPRANLLLAGMENVHHIEFSRDGRFLFAQSFAGSRMVYARVWDLTTAWEITITKAIENNPSLQELVCHLAAIEPDGDHFTSNELNTVIGKSWEQPCPVPPDRSHPH